MIAPPNVCRIDCKTAPHSDGTSGTGVAPTGKWPRNGRDAVRSRCRSAPAGARANTRRFGNLLQVLDCPLAEPGEYESASNMIVPLSAGVPVT